MAPVVVSICTAVQALLNSVKFFGCKSLDEVKSLRNLVLVAVALHQQLQLDATMHNDLPIFIMQTTCDVCVTGRRARLFLTGCVDSLQVAAGGPGAATPDRWCHEQVVTPDKWCQEQVVTPDRWWVCREDYSPPPPGSRPCSGRTSNDRFAQHSNAHQFSRQQNCSTRKRGLNLF